MVDKLYTDKKKRILAIVGAIPCDNNVYAGIFTINQMIELVKTNKYEIDIIFLRPMFPRLANWIIRRIKRNFLVLDRPIGLKTKCIKVHLIPYLHLPKLGTFMMILTAYFYILLKRVKFDIIHAYFLFFPGYLGLKLRDFFKKPLVVTAMGDDVTLLYQNSMRENLIHPQIPEKILRTLKKSEAVVAKSQYLKQRIIDAGIPEDKVVVINNGVSKEKFRAFGLRCPALNGGEKIILYIGSLLVEKGLVQLLEAVKILGNKRKDFLLIMIGEGPFRDGLLKLMGELKVEKFVRMEGQKDHEEIPEWINRSYVVCLPSHNEGLPNILIESIACGIPVVASDVGGIPEIVNDEKLGILVPPKNGEKLALALGEALDREWDRAVIAKSGARFHWERMLSKYDEVYNRLF